MMELLTTEGKRKLVRAFGMEKISEKVPYICFNRVKHLFSVEVQNEWEKVTSRPVGAIELLVGAEVASYFPDKLETKGEFVVTKSAFGSGYAVFGSHPEIKAERVQFSEEVTMIRQTKMKVSAQYANQVSMSHNFVEKFMEAEGQQYTEQETMVYQDQVGEWRRIGDCG